MANATFIPNDDYTGPAIELTCGKHTKDGKFRPKNIKLTSIARLNKFEHKRDYQSEWNLYEATMKQKNPTWTREAAEARWEAAGKSYYAEVRAVRIESKLNTHRRRYTRQVLQLALAA